MNLKLFLLTLFLFSLNLSLLGQDKNPFLKEELLISTLNYGSVDTIDLVRIINGTDKESYFIDQKGDSINYLSFKDKVVLVDFWFLACPPCIVELSGLDLLNKKLRSEDFKIITFAMDSLGEIDEKLLSKKDFNFRIVPNISLVANKDYPLKLLVDRKGSIVDYKHGGNAGKNSISILLEKYLPLIETEIKR